jgi:hypothetical protein
MERARRDAWRRWGSVAALVALPAAPLAADAGAETSAPKATLRATVDASTRHLLGQALRGASLRLAEPACQAVLADFRDGTGRTLDRALGEAGFTAPEYLWLAFFADGAGHPRCEAGDVGAFTVPGSRVVRVCPHAVRRLSRLDPALVEALLIHEMLHTLGLPEGPATAGAPTTEAISARVESRCLAAASGRRSQ